MTSRNAEHGMGPWQSVLERYPDHVKAIGMINIEVGNLERMLGELLGALLHIDSAISQIIYLSPAGNGARLTILKNVGDATFKAESIGRKTIDRIVDKARKYVNKRHELIHAGWGVSAANPEQGPIIVSLPLKASKSERQVPISELNELIKNLRTLIDEVLSHTAELYAEWPQYTLPKTLGEQFLEYDHPQTDATQKYPQTEEETHLEREHPQTPSLE